MFIIPFCVFLLTLLIFYVRKIKLRKWLKNVSGPKPNIFLGNIKDLIGKSTYEYLDLLSGFHNNYGSTIKIHDGPLSVFILTKDAKFVEHLLSSTKLIDKSTQYDFLCGWLGTGLLTSTGMKWKKRRRMITPSFHFSILENYIDIFDSAGDVFIKKLEQEIDKKSVNISPFVSLCTLDAICEAAMGIKLKSQDNTKSEYVKSVKVMGSIVTDRMFSAIHSFFYPLSINYFRERKAIKILHAHTDNIINKKLTQDKKKSPDSAKQTNDTGKEKRLVFIDLLLNSSIDGKPLSKVDIREEVDTFVFEGHDTISAMIGFAFYALAENYEIQEKVYREQKSIFDDIKNAKPNMSQLQAMKYLELVIKETLRLYPSVPIIGRNLVEDVTWDGVDYPKGQNISIFIYGLHRDPEHFPEPTKFIPERFKNTNWINPYVYIPFSAGPRNCIGQKFAMLEMKSLLSKVIRNFEIHPSVPHHKLLLSPEAVLVSKNGVCVSLKKRP